MRRRDLLWPAVCDLASTTDCVRLHRLDDERRSIKARLNAAIAGGQIALITDLTERMRVIDSEIDALRRSQAMPRAA